MEPAMKLYSNRLAMIVFGAALTVNVSVYADNPQAVTPPKTTQQQQLSIKDVQRFTAAISQIKNYYVVSISDQELFNNAIRGMLEGLDPHSSFLDADEYKELTSSTRGEFAGLGLEVTMENGLVKVVTPIDETPGQKAGIKAGDMIVLIDNTPIKGMTLKDAVKKMRGQKGTAVDLTVVRQGVDKPLRFHLLRDVVLLKSVKAKMLEPGLGYVRIAQFQTTTADDLTKSINELKKDSGGKLNGLILDLRNNPGGLLDSAIAVSNIFLDSAKLKNKTIVYTKTRIPGADFSAKADSVDLLNGAPVVVLINQGSASAAEIVAGALQDQKRALLLGNQTFGKGSVQTVLPLDDSTAAILTTALYYTPNGRSIQATGITPDISIDDVKIDKNGNDKDIPSIRESNLIGHLANGNGITSKAAKNESADTLVYNDYALEEALHILKGLAIERNN
jgi:carboxyl-terminal processing protease